MRIMIFPCFFWTLGNWVFEYPRTNIYQLCPPLQVTCKSLILSSGTIVAGYMCTCVYVAKALAACPGALCWDARERGGLYVLVIEIAMDHKKWMVNICKHHDLIWFTYCNTLKRSTSRCEIARGYIYIYHGYDAMHAYIYIHCYRFSAHHSHQAVSQICGSTKNGTPFLLKAMTVMESIKTSACL